MNFHDQEKILKKLIKLPKENILGVYGTDEESQELFHYLKRHDLNITAFITDDDTQQGGVCGVPVMPMSEYVQMQEKKAVVSAQEIKELANDEVKYVYIKKNKLTRKISKFVQFFQDNLHGYKLYQMLIKKYGNDVEILVFQGKSGDLYNAGVYLTRYIQGTNTVLLVIGQACLATAQIFKIQNIEQISLYDAECLVKLYCLLGENIGITPVHRSQGNLSSGIFNNIQSRQGMTLGKLFKYYTFNFGEEVKPALPDYVRDDGYIKKLMEQTGLQKNNTVILSPYANSYMDDDLFPFWERLAEKLKDMGYKVFTNSAGITEPPIKGTDTINFDLINAGYVLEQAGTFIALRSGFCDIVSSSRCKKIILYCEDIRKNIDFYKYHSFKELELSEDCIEIQYNRERYKWEELLFQDVLCAIDSGKEEFSGRRFMNQYFEELLKTINTSIQTLDQDTFSYLVEECVKTIKTGKKIVVSGLGKNVPICEKFVGTMLSLGLNAAFLHTNTAVHGDLGAVHEGDLVIVLTKSGKTAESINLVQHLKIKKAQVWLLTFTKYSVLQSKVDHTLVLELNHEGDMWDIVPNNSTTLNLIVLQAVALCTAEKLGVTLEEFKENHPGGYIGERLNDET